MTTTLTKKGQVVLPAAARKRLGLKAGAKFACRVQSGKIVLTPAASKRVQARLVKDKLTGMIAVAARPGGPVITSEQVRALLADFP
ncbi:MAG: AbrB/MazE/SpoVT family DNA-binding domain-containing protein [Opitutaceae bacterium]